MQKNHHADIKNSGNADQIVSNRLISKSAMIAEVVDEYPEAIGILIENGMHCIGCGASMFETLEEGFIGHGMNDAEINKVMDELNDFIKKNPKK
jgi:hydroxylamine reductase